MVGGKDHTTHCLVYSGLNDKQVWLIFFTIALLSCLIAVLAVAFAKWGNPGMVFFLSLFFVLVFVWLYRNTIIHKRWEEWSRKWNGNVKKGWRRISGSLRQFYIFCHDRATARIRVWIPIGVTSSLRHHFSILHFPFSISVKVISFVFNRKSIDIENLQITLLTLIWIRVYRVRIHNVRCNWADDISTLSVGSVPSSSYAEWTLYSKCDQVDHGAILMKIYKSNKEYKMNFNVIIKVRIVVCLNAFISPF